MSEDDVDRLPDEGAASPPEEEPHPAAATPAGPQDNLAGPERPAAADPERSAEPPDQRTWDGKASQVSAEDGAGNPDGGEYPKVANDAEESLDARYDDEETRSRSVRSDFPRRSGPEFDIHGHKISMRDIAGRDIYNFNSFLASGDVRARGPISIAHLVRAAQVYVTTGSDASLERLCREDRFVFLRGRRESGRRSSAVVVLDSLTGRCRTKSLVTVLDAASGLGGLAERLDEGHGHLLDASAEGWLDTVSEARVAEIRAALGRTGYLIVLVDTATARSLPGEVVEHEVPDPAQVVSFHLAAKLAGGRDITDADRRAAGELLRAALRASNEAAEWYEEITTSANGTATAPAEASHLAEAIWEWRERREADDTATLRVRHYRELRFYQQARLLLRRGDRDDSPLRQAYVIAASVLDGLAVSEVADGARQLARLLQEVEHPGESGGRRIFAEPLAHWLSHVAIAAPAAEPDRRRTDGGTTIAKMPSRRLARTIIEVAWLDYDAARLPLLRWLVQLCGEHGDDRVRIRAAQALAVIAGHDYPQIKMRVLEEWSESNQPIDHQAAAWLLEAATLDGTVADQVQVLLRRWSRSGGRGKRAIALRAYGTAASMTAPADAIRGVRVSAADATFGALPELALCEMYVQGLHADVLEELTFWTRAFPPMRERVGRVLVRISRVRRAGDAVPGCYDLLWRMANEPEKAGIDLAALADLWKLACQQPRSKGAAWQMLGFWAQNCRDHPALQDTFIRLIDTFEKAADPAELRARLRVYRRRWSIYLAQEEER